MTDDLRNALVGVLVAIEIAQIQMMNLEKALVVGEGADPRLAQKFETLRASLTRAEHAARTKLGESK